MAFASPLLACVAVAFFALAAPIVPAQAQSVGAAMFGEKPASPNAQMLLEADQLVYDNDQNVVSAVGNVLITYDNYTLTAKRVTYSRTSGRVIASGNVE
ncbi:MAG: LPS-assembly protein LptD, partial [Novosphingobium sp.]|nr:LPS-assembly protein LptD [Novosphingobium sp.]